MKAGVLSAAVAALALAASGCGGGGTKCESGGGFRPVQRDVPRGTRYLTEVSVARTSCADRVEFAFEHGVPGYRIEYVGAQRAQTEDASGRHIPVGGRAFILVRLADAATARSNGDTFSRTYTGPRRVTNRDAQAVQEVVKTGDFEAVVTWSIGLDRKRPFSVSTSQNSVSVEIG